MIEVTFQVNYVFPKISFISATAGPERPALFMFAPAHTVASENHNPGHMGSSSNLHESPSSAKNLKILVIQVLQGTCLAVPFLLSYLVEVHDD